MKNIIEIFLFLVLIVAHSGCANPKEGVIERCAKEFSVPELATHKFEILLSEEGSFDAPKYHLKLLEGNFEDIEKLLHRAGYKDWEKGELSFDGVSFGWREKDLQYSKINKNGSTYYAAISKEKKEVIFVRYP